MKVVTCIICHEEGRLNAFKPKDSHQTKYYVGHEGLGYDWGTSVKESERMEAIRRCYLTKPHQRSWARQKLAELF